MALGGKTVQYTLAVNMETGQLSAESRKVATELGLIQKSADKSGNSFIDFGRQAKQLKSELSLLFLGSFGGYSLVVGVLEDAIRSAGVAFQDAFGERAINAAAMDDFLTAQLKSVREIGLSKTEIFEIELAQIEATEQLIQLENQRAQANRQYATENWWQLLLGSGGQSAFFAGMAAASTDVTNAISKTKDALKGFTDRKAAIDEIRNGFLAMENAAKQTKVQIDNTAQALILMRDLPGNPLSFLTSGSALQDRFTPLDFGVTAPGQIGGELPETPVAKLKTELDELVENSGLYQSFFIGLADGFASFGAAIVESQNPLKNFGAVFLKMIAQLAIQFGTFLILYGTGMGFVPGGQSFSAGAIAAGVALTVFGGALGALANRLGGVGSGSRTSEREQRFRDSRFNTSGSGGTTINNYINFQNTIGLTRDAMKEVGEAVSKEIFKQTKLGRVETVPA